ncbi:MAG TPA: hypothetical protein PK095_09320 [Myxococcota bacterium]|nr:hypothetical protein [Myxococcota bacterium]
MPFDFMKKDKDKNKNSGHTTSAPSRTKQLVGGLASFDAQAKALMPSEEKGKGPLDALKAGHPLKALKRAFGKGEKADLLDSSDKPDPALVAKVSSVHEAAWNVRSIAESLTWLLSLVKVESKEGGHKVDRAAEMLARVDAGQRAGTKVVAAERKLHAAAMDWHKTGGSLTRIQACIGALLVAMQELHAVLYGHPGPEDHKTPEGILYDPISPHDKLIGGRSRTSEEARNPGGMDKRSGPAGDYKYPRLPVSRSDKGVSMGKSVYIKSAIWVSAYKTLGDAVMDLGVVI